MQEAGSTVPPDLQDAVLKREEQLRSKARKEAERRAKKKAKTVPEEEDSTHNNTEASFSTPISYSV